MYRLKKVENTTKGAILQPFSWLMGLPFLDRQGSIDARVPFTLLEG
jgi:hypothetical protein